MAFSFPRLPLSMQVAALRASTYVPTPFNLWAVPSLAAQMVTYREKFPVARYKNVAALTAAMAPLWWIEDFWNGKLDVLKHPTFMQEAMAVHPTYADDCDGYAAYSCVALLKSRIADEVYFGSAQWVDPKKNELAGHAVCVYRDPLGWHWIGNWNACKPYDGLRDQWVTQMEQALKGPKILVAQQFEAILGPNDTLLLGKRRVLRR